MEGKPSMEHLSKMKNCVRYFYLDKHNERFKRLIECENISKLVCWPCLIFENDKDSGIDLIKTMQ